MTLLCVSACHDMLIDVMETLSVAEAKRRFSELLDRVGRGERFMVARRGRPTVALVSPDEVPPRSVGRPRGALALLGALADADGFHELMLEIVGSRQKARDRPVRDLPVD